MELGPEDVPLLERCPHFRGWYVQASMELGPEDVSLLERCLCICRLLPDISSLGLDNMGANPIQSFTTSTPNDDPTPQASGRCEGAVKGTGTRPRVAGKKSDRPKMASPSRDATSRPNKTPSVEPAKLPQSDTPTIERDNPPLSMKSLLEGDNVKVRKLYGV